MDLLDRLLEHDAWTTDQLLIVCTALDDEQLDHEFDMGHRSLRATLDHMIYNMEIWTSLMQGKVEPRDTDLRVDGMRSRLQRAASRLSAFARAIADRDGWDETWVDTLDNPPTRKTYGGSIAHVITHNMHHRAQLLYMLRQTGVSDLPEGDVLSWEMRSAGS